MADSYELPELVKAPRKDSFGSLLGKTLIIILGLVAVGAFVSWSFGWVAVESYNPSELYEKISSGRPEVKRMASAEWSRQLARLEAADSSGRAFMQARPQSEQIPLLAQELLAQSQRGNNADSVYAGALATILSYAADAVPARVALKQVVAPFEQEKSVDAFLYLVLAIARLGTGQDAELEALFMRAAQHPDASLRKASILGLARTEGAQKSLSSAAGHQLESLLSDGVEDVRWNAAFVLARHQNRAALPVISQLLQRIEEGDSVVLQDEIVVQVFRAIVALPAENLLPRLRVISQNHRYPGVRQRAREAIERWGQSEESS